MTKELEDLLIEFDEMGYEPTTLCENPQKEIETFRNKLKQALTELQAIKEAKPSEALRKLDTIRHLEMGFDKNGKPITLNDTSALKIIEKALITKSKKEQAFDIIKTKCVDIDYLKNDCHFLLVLYNKYLIDDKQLTKEEYDLLKEVLK